MLFFFPYFRSRKPLMWSATSKAPSHGITRYTMAGLWYNCHIPWLWSEQLWFKLWLNPLIFGSTIVQVCVYKNEVQFICMHLISIYSLKWNEVHVVNWRIIYLLNTRSILQNASFWLTNWKSALIWQFDGTCKVWLLQFAARGIHRVAYIK